MELKKKKLKLQSPIIYFNSIFPILFLALESETFLKQSGEIFLGNDSFPREVIDRKTILDLLLLSSKYEDAHP